MLAYVSSRPCEQLRSRFNIRRQLTFAGMRSRILLGQFAFGRGSFPYPLAAETRRDANAEDSAERETMGNLRSIAVIFEILIDCGLHDLGHFHVVFEGGSLEPFLRLIVQWAVDVMFGFAIARPLQVTEANSRIFSL